MNEWPVVNLSEVSSNPQYGAIARGADEPIGPRFVRQTDIVGGSVDWGSVPYCDLSPEQADKYRLRTGDLLVSRLGNGVGNAVTVKRLPYEAVYAGYLVRFSVQHEMADPIFVGYHLQSQRWRNHVSSFRSGAAQPTLNAKQMGAFEFPLPSLEEQRGIAATLGALDDKIASNRRAVEVATELIQSQVRRALEGDSTAIAVADLARFINGGAYTKGATGTGRMVIRIKELNSGPGGSTVYNDIEVPEDKTARTGDILMSWSGSLGVYRWFRDEAIINQHIFKVLPQGYPDWLVYDRLNSVIAEFQAIAKDKATTMGHIQRGHLESTQVKLPTPEKVETLDVALTPLWERIKVAEQETQKLAALRDTLLPELLSGRIRVPEAAEVVSSA